MNRSAISGLLLALAIPLASYFIVKTFSYKAVAMPRHYIYDTTTIKTVNGKQVEDTVWHRLPDIALYNHLGKKVGWNDMEGKVVVANFFFTHCPTICPQLTRNMKGLQEGITNGRKAAKGMADFVHYLSFSVDPERDSVAALKKWADKYQVNPESWWLLTGPKKEIYDLSIEHMKLLAIDGEGVDTSFIHTDRMVLIDKYRNIRGYYHGLDTASLAQLSRDIVMLSLEKDPNRKKFYEGKLELVAIVFLLTLVGLGALLYFLKKDKKEDGAVN